MVSDAARAVCAHRNESGMSIKRLMTNPPFPPYLLLSWRKQTIPAGPYCHQKNRCPEQMCRLPMSESGHKRAQAIVSIAGVNPTFHQGSMAAVYQVETHTPQQFARAIR